VCVSAHEYRTSQMISRKHEYVGVACRPAHSMDCAPSSRRFRPRFLRRSSSPTTPRSQTCCHSVVVAGQRLLNILRWEAEHLTLFDSEILKSSIAA
jgi:hypothetical protein